MYIKSVLWRVAKPLSYIEDARCLRVKDSMSQGEDCLCSQVNSERNSLFIMVL